MPTRLLKRFAEIANVRGFDEALKSAWTHLYDLARSKIHIKKFEERTERTMYMNYDLNRKSELARLCDKYGTDKGELTPDSNPYPWPSHSYSDFYELIFESRKNSVETLLECGIGTTDTDIPYSMGEKGKPGASLRVWRDYFPNAEIVGVDIDDDVLFSEDRITTFCVDQTSKESINSFINRSGVDELDIIIDDGLHEYHANITLFENTIDHMTGNGVYIIEDVHYRDIEKFREYFDEHSEQYHATFVDLETPGRSDRKRDRLIMIKTQ